VTVHSNHLHDAPLIYEEVHEQFADSVPGVHNEAYFSSVLNNTHKAIASALAGDGVEIGGIRFGSATVRNFASTRRVLDDKDRCSVRWSVLDDDSTQHLKRAPEGKIDPVLDQIVLYNTDQRPCVAISSYASHPQVSDGRLTWSSDTIGVARELFEKCNPEVMTLHFTGCGGDVTAGKYSSSNRHRNRLVFGVRLYDAMQEAFDSARPEPLRCIGWVNRQFDMPLREEEYGEQHFRQILDDPEKRTVDKYLASLKYFKLRNNITHYPFRLSRLQLNDNNVLFLPAELSVEYQLYAKLKSTSHLVAIAYGDCFLNYVATDEAFQQGGYEVQPEWTEVRPGCEGLIKRAIDEILGETTAVMRNESHHQ
jgi:hypothetical protein